MGEGWKRAVKAAKASRKPKAKKPAAHTILTAIVVDFMGHGFGEVTREDEIEEHKERFSEFVTPAKLKPYTPMSTYPGELKPGTDLVIYDFGGLMPGSESLMTNNARHLLQWAADNPNSLVVIVSTFSYENCVKYEAEELGLTDLHNIVADSSMGGFDLADPDKQNPWYKGKRYSPLPEWFERAHGIESKEYE